jgi:4-azaleucine resistance transporter AzlC
VDDPVRFTFAGVTNGIRRSLPIGLSVFAYGLVFGVLARQAGLSLVEAALMSGWVFAGASQFVALDLWVSPLPVPTLILTTLVLNLRHVLMGAAVYPWFAPLRARQVYPTLYFMTDENWALSMRQYAAGERDGGFLLGSGLVIYLAWLSAAIGGQMLGASIPDPARWGLDFAFTAVFAALLVGMWQGKQDVLPWAVAAAAALLGSYWMPGKWYILIGGLTGSLAGAFLDGKRNRVGEPSEQAANPPTVDGKRERNDL